MFLSKLSRYFRIPAAVMLFFFTWLCVEPWNFSKEYRKQARAQQQIPVQPEQPIENSWPDNAVKTSIPEDPWPALMGRLDYALTALDVEAAPVQTSLPGGRPDFVPAPEMEIRTMQSAQAQIMSVESLDSVMSDIRTEYRQSI